MSDAVPKIVFEKLTLAQMAAQVDAKLFEFEAALYDATLEMNLALAAEQDERFAAEQKRAEDLSAGLLFLRRERAAMNARTEEIPVATAVGENEREEEG